MTFLKHDSCEQCGSSDAKALYDDGSSHCFSCGNHLSANPVTKFKNKDKVKNDNTITRSKKNNTGNLPEHCESWLQKYNLSSTEKLLFDYDHNKNWLGYYEGGFANFRNFNQDDPRKYISYGEKPYSVMGSGNMLLLVEDIVSAIKVSRHAASCCLFGSSIPLLPIIMHHGGVTDTILIWLDHDKLLTAVKSSKQFNELGYRCGVIDTPLDPKEYNDEEIINILDRYRS